MSGKFSGLRFSSILISFLLGIHFGSNLMGCSSIGFGRDRSQTGSHKIESTTVVDLESRPGVSQKFVYMEVENPLGTIIVIADSKGILELSKFMGSPQIGIKDRFPVRTRKIFLKSGYSMAFMDCVSDKVNDIYGLNVVWRMDKEHEQDIRAVAEYIKGKNDGPIWALGVHRATFSVVNAGINLSDVIDGIILISSVTSRPGSDSHEFGILDMPLEQISVPALVVHHRKDDCPYTPSFYIHKVNEKMINSPNNELALFTDGDKGGKPCGHLSYHGYKGIEDEVLNKIIEFIKAN